MAQRLGLGLCVFVAAACAATEEQPDVRASRVSEAPREATARSQTQRDYLVTRPDLRKCAYPLCGGVYVAEVNQSESVCADGQSAPDCYVSDIDLSALGLDPEQAGELGNAARGGSVLLRGQLVAPNTPHGPIGQLQVADAWRGVVGTTHQDPIYLVVDSGIVCITYPCPSLSQLLLNGEVAESLSGLDLTTSGASQADIDAAHALIEQPGAMVAGTHVTVSGPAGTGLELEASEIYLPVATADACADAAAHDPCTTGDAADASCSSCASLVCGADPFCCDHSWDALCVDQALEVCSDVCAPPAPSCAHSECAAGGKLDAGCSSCAAVVCGSDAYCCETAWDGLCVEEAASWCSDTCD